MTGFTPDGCAHEIVTVLPTTFAERRVGPGLGLGAVVVVGVTTVVTGGMPGVAGMVVGGVGVGSVVVEVEVTVVAGGVVLVGDDVVVVT